MAEHAGCSDRSHEPQAGARSAPVRVKVCGVTCPRDAIAAVEAGADWIGMNFHPASPRFVQPAEAATIVAELPPTASAVGVFVDRPALNVIEVADRVGLKLVQLHGNEPPETIRALKARGLYVVRAYRLVTGETLRRIRAALEHTFGLADSDAAAAIPDAILADAYVEGQAGGTGRTIPDEMLELLRALPRGRLILAGGLTPENVADRVRRVRPWMVDVASGVESAPGRKDPHRIAAFILAARAGAAGLA